MKQLDDIVDLLHEFSLIHAEQISVGQLRHIFIKRGGIEGADEKLIVINAIAPEIFVCGSLEGLIDLINCCNFTVLVHTVHLLRRIQRIIHGLQKILQGRRIFSTCDHLKQTLHGDQLRTQRIVKRAEIQLILKDDRRSRAGNQAWGCAIISIIAFCRGRHAHMVLAVFADHFLPGPSILIGVFPSRSLMPLE